MEINLGFKSMVGRAWVQHLHFLQYEQLIEQNLVSTDQKWTVTVTVNLKAHPLFIFKIDVSHCGRSTGAGHMTDNGR